MLEAVGLRHPARKSARNRTLDGVPAGGTAPLFFVAKVAHGVCGATPTKFDADSTGLESHQSRWFRAEAGLIDLVDLGLTKLTSKWSLMRALRPGEIVVEMSGDVIAS